MECRILFLGRFTKKLVNTKGLYAVLFCTGGWSCYSAVNLDVHVFPVCVSANYRCLAIGYILRRSSFAMLHTNSVFCVVGRLNGPNLNFYLGKPPSYLSALYHFFLFYILVYKFSFFCCQGGDCFQCGLQQIPTCRTTPFKWVFLMWTGQTGWSSVMWFFGCLCFPFVKLCNLFILNISSALLCCRKLANTSITGSILGNIWVKTDQIFRLMHFMLRNM